MAVISGFAPVLIPAKVDGSMLHEVRSPDRRIPNNANRSITVLFDMDAVDRVNPLTNADLFLELFLDGQWVPTSRAGYVGGNWLNKDGTPQTTGPGFKIASVERDPVTQAIVRDLRGVDVRVGIRNNSTAIPFTSGILIDAR